MSENNFSEKMKALERAMQTVAKKYGEGMLFKLTDGANLKIPTISTGSLLLDIAAGGGIPRGRVTEIFGHESSGKTTLCLNAIASVQRKGEVAAFIDMEHSLSPEYARSCGVKTGELLFSQPDTGEMALEIAETLAASGAVSLIVVDSVAALVPQAELGGVIGDPQMGNQARLMSQALRKMNGILSSTNTALVFTNQIRQKIGVMFGNPETTPGGNALKFFASLRIEVKKMQILKNGETPYGHIVRAKVVKNKIAAPFRSADFTVLFGKGVWKEEELLTAGIQSHLIEKKGNYYYYEQNLIGSGKKQATEWLASHSDVAEHIEQKVRENLNAFLPDKEPFDGTVED